MNNIFVSIKFYGEREIDPKELRRNHIKFLTIKDKSVHIFLIFPFI